MALRLPKLHPAIKRLLAVLAAIGLYGLAGGVGLPWLLRHQLSQWNAMHPELNASVQRIRFNPFQAKLTLHQLDLAAPAAPPRFHVDKITASIKAWDSLRTQRLTISKIRIVAPSLDINGDTADGLFISSSSAPSALSLQIDQLSLKQGHLRYQSAGGTAPLTLQLDAITFQLEHFASDSKEPAALTLSALGAQGEKLEAHASLNLSPFSVDAALQLDALPLPPLWQRYLHLPALTLNQGTASLQTPITYRDDQGVVIGPGSLRLHELELTDSEQQTPLLQALSIELRRVTLDLNRQRADIAAITADHARLASWLVADGTLNYARYAQNDHASDGKPAWHYRIGRVELKDSELHLQDHSHPDGLKLALAPLSLQLAALSNEVDAPPLNLSLVSTVETLGHLELKLSGDAKQGMTADINAQQIGLRPLNGYLQSIAKVKWVDGNLDLNGHLEYRAEGTPQLQFTGTAAIDQLAINRQDDDLELLKWQRLTVKGLSYAYPGGPLHITEIAADRPYARIVIEADQTLNWTKLKVNNGKPSKAGPALPIIIDALRIHNGTADFADRTLSPDFAATIQQLHGAVKGLSSSPDARAALLLEGKVDQFAPVRVQGLINPLRADAYTDIEMRFHNMDLIRLSPYSGKFAGYRIDKGKLTLDMRYRLENRKLEAENQIIMDHLTLGERVDSRTATSLPIGLAIALLRDSTGKIDIHLPVSGNLDDPHFSLRDLYAQAITGLITKLVTSPFTVLGNLLEGNAEEYARVAFFPGKDLLSTYQKEKLMKLADALLQRSGLTLEIRGIADPDKDRAALAETRLQNRLRRHWLNELRAKGFVDAEVPGHEHSPIPDADYRRLVLEQYTESGLGIAQDQEQALNALLEKFAASDTDLRLLAQQRAERIRHFLAENGGIAERRLYLLDVQVETKPGQQLEAVLMLNGS